MPKINFQVKQPVLACQLSLLVPQSTNYSLIIDDDTKNLYLLSTVLFLHKVILENLPFMLLLM